MPFVGGQNRKFNEILSIGKMNENWSKAKYGPNPVTSWPITAKAVSGLAKCYAKPK